MREIGHTTATALPLPMDADKPDWLDEYQGGDNLNRMLEGKTFRTGDPEIGQRRFMFTIREVLGVTVGIDSKGIFASVRVIDHNGFELSLYTDGSVQNLNDELVGTHSFRTFPPEVH